MTVSVNVGSPDMPRNGFVRPVGYMETLFHLLANARTHERMLQGIAALGGSVPAGADSDLACGATGSLAYDAIVTHLGVPPLPAEPGAPRLDAFWGPSVQGRFSDEIVIGAATPGGQLRVTQTSPEHIESPVESLRADLLNACEGRQ